MLILLLLLLLLLLSLVDKHVALLALIFNLVQTTAFVANQLTLELPNCCPNSLG